MNKNLMLSTAAAAILAATTAQAGVYVGAGLGYTSFNGKEKAVKSGDTLTPRNNGNLKSSLSPTGMRYHILTGYEHDFAKNFFGAAEVELGINDASKKKNKLTLGQMGKRNLEAKEFFGIHGRLGYKVAEKTKLYAKLGVQSTKFEYKTTDLYESIPNRAISAKKNKRLTGIVYGAGVEQGFTDKLAVRFELTHANHGTIKTNTKTNTGDTATTKHSVKLQSTSGTATLVYKI